MVDTIREGITNYELPITKRDEWTLLPNSSTSGEQAAAARLRLPSKATLWYVPLVDTYGGLEE